MDPIGTHLAPLCDPPGFHCPPLVLLRGGAGPHCPPFGSLLAPFAPPATLLAFFGSPLVLLMRRFPHPAPVDTVEQSRNHRSAPFSALQTHVCQKQNICQPTIFDIIPGFVSTTNLHAPPPGGSTAIFLCKVAYGGKQICNFGISLGSLWDHFELTCR